MMIFLDSLSGRNNVETDHIRHFYFQFILDHPYVLSAIYCQYQIDYMYQPTIRLQTW